jgi:putative ABC transport system substrate-binding protein
VVGFLDSRSPGEDASGALAFQKGLGDVGFVEGHNVKLDSRWAEGQYDRLPALVADLIRHRSCIA